MNESNPPSTGLMKILLQQVGTELFLGEDGTWTRDKALGRVFSNSLDALRYCVERQIPDANIALCFDDPRFDLRLPAFRKRSPATEPNLPERKARFQSVEENRALPEKKKRLAGESDSMVAEGKQLAFNSRTGAGTQRDRPE